MQQPTAAQEAYWEAQLARYKLSMSRGLGSHGSRSKSHDDQWLFYGHEVKHLDFDGVAVFKSATRKKLGESTDTEYDEWPISLF